MILKVFTKNGCPKCPSAKKIAKKLEKNKNGLKVQYFNISKFEGLAEASFYSVMATPSLVLCDERGGEIFSWRGEAPLVEAVLKKIR